VASYPKDDYEFWLYLAHALLEQKAFIPGFLKEITDFDAIREPLAELKRRREIERWREQLRNIGQHGVAQTSAPVDFRLVSNRRRR